MALVLTLGGSDKDFYVDDTQVVLKKIINNKRFILRVIKSGMDMEYEITDQVFTEILPNVRVCSGLLNPKNRSKTVVKVMIEAPKQIKLLRGVHYRENNGC